MRAALRIDLLSFSLLLYYNRKNYSADVDSIEEGNFHGAMPV